MGLFNFHDIGGLLSRMAANAPVASALIDGDYAGAARLRSVADDQATAVAKSKHDDAEEQQFTAALRANGVPENQIPILLANRKAVGEQYATRYATRTVDEGSSVRTPNMDGSASVFTAPKTFKEGADVIQSAPGQSSLPVPMGNPLARAPMIGDGAAPDGNSSFSVSYPTRLMGLRSEAEQYADTVAKHGTTEWGQAVKDYVLKGNGPTAIDHSQALLDDRLDTSRRNTDVRAGVSRRGQDFSHQDRQRGFDVRTHGQDLTDSRVRGSAAYQGRGGRGGGSAAVAVSPDGHRIVVQNGRWVDAQTGQPVQ